MKFVSFDANGAKMDEWICYSVGGGALSEGEKGRWLTSKREVYQKNTLQEIQTWCENTDATTGSMLTNARKKTSGTTLWRYGRLCS